MDLLGLFMDAYIGGLGRQGSHGRRFACRGPFLTGDKPTINAESASIVASDTILAAELRCAVLIGYNMDKAMVQYRLMFRVFCYGDVVVGQ